MSNKENFITTLIVLLISVINTCKGKLLTKQKSALVLPWPARQRVGEQVSVIRRSFTTKWQRISNFSVNTVKYNDHKQLWKYGLILAYGYKENFCNDKEGRAAISSTKKLTNHVSAHKKWTGKLEVWQGYKF